MHGCREWHARLLFFSVTCTPCCGTVMQFCKRGLWTLQGSSCSWLTQAAHDAAAQVPAEH